MSYQLSNMCASAVSGNIMDVVVAGLAGEMGGAL